MYQTLNSAIAEKLRLEAQHQVRPSPIPTRDEPLNDLHSLLAGNLRRPELASNWHPGLNLGLLPPELQLSLLSTQLMQANSDPRLALFNQRDRLAEKKLEESRSSKPAEAIGSQLSRHSSAVISPKAKRSGESAGFSNLHSNSSGNANKLIKNTTTNQISEKIKPTIQKDSKNNFPTHKEPELIIIDDSEESEGTNETDKKPNNGVKEVPKESQSFKKLPSTENSKTDNLQQLKNENSSGKAPLLKKPGTAKVSYDEKINHLQNIEVGPSKSLEPSHSAGSHTRPHNDIPNRMAANPHPYYGYLPSEYAGLPMTGFPDPLAGYGQLNPTQLLALQMLSQNMGRNYLEDMLMQQYLLKRMAQYAAWPQVNPLAGSMEPATKVETHETEKAKQFAFVTAKENKEVIEKNKKNVIQIIDDNGEPTEINEASSGQMTLVEKRLCGENKVQKKIFQIKTNRPAAKKQESTDDSRKLRSQNAVAETVKQEKISMSALIPKALRKTRSSCAKEAEAKAKGEESMEGNLELKQQQQKKVTRASARAQGSLVASTIAEIQLKKGRQKNKLQIMAEERDKLFNDFKEEKQEEEEEEEYAPLCDAPDYFNTKKRLKPVKTGDRYQAVIPPLAVNQVNVVQPRKFKSVWKPDSIGDEKVQEFLSTAKQILGLDTYHEDFLLRLLSKDNMDCEKLLNILQTNQEYFVNLFKLKRSFNPLKRALQVSQLLQQQSGNSTPPNRAFI